MKLLVLLSFMSSCAFGPLINSETATTVGKANHEWHYGLGSPGYLVKYSYGLSDNLDIGAQLETLSLGLRLKYAFINNKSKGFSLALAGGAGTSVGGSHQYVDFMTSYKVGQFEPYFTYRYVWSEVDETEVEGLESGEGGFTIDAFNYVYSQAFLGFKYSYTSNWSVNLEVSTIMAVESISVDGGPIYAFSFTRLYK